MRSKFPDWGGKRKLPGELRVAIQLQFAGWSFEVSVPHASPAFADAAFEFVKQWTGKMSTRDGKQ